MLCRRIGLSPADTLRLGNLQCLLNGIQFTLIHCRRHRFLTLDLRLHRGGTGRPGTLDLFVQMLRSAVTGERHILTQQTVGIRRRFRRQLHAVVRHFFIITRCELNIVNQFVEQCRIGSGIAFLALLVIIALQPEIATRIVGRQLHNEFIIGFVSNAGLIGAGGRHGPHVQITQELLLGIISPQRIHCWPIGNRRRTPLLFHQVGNHQRYHGE
ncbi:hypothetical protein D3C81_981350 [compost metagenome]